MATKNDKEFALLTATAHQKGMEALYECKPVPMNVVRVDPLTGKPIAGTQVYHVADGVCGFAWVHLSKGNTSFARWAKKNNIARTSYYGGMDIWVSEGSQSMQKKEAYANAYAKVLQDAGIECYPDSRMD